MKCMNYVMATTILKAWAMMEALMINIKDGKNEFFWFFQKITFFSMCVGIIDWLSFESNQIRRNQK